MGFAKRAGGVVGNGAERTTMLNKRFDGRMEFVPKSTCFFLAFLAPFIPYIAGGAAAVGATVAVKNYKAQRKAQRAANIRQRAALATSRKEQGLLQSRENQADARNASTAESLARQRAQTGENARDQGRVRLTAYRRKRAVAAAREKRKETGGGLNTIH